jgi:ferredoxin
VAGVETLSVASVFDKEGRFNPQFVPGSEVLIEADTVLLAIGQRSEPTLMHPNDSLPINRRGLLDAAETLMTSRPGVFAGGDIVTGPRLFIDAVLQGQLAARSIHEYLAGVKVKVRRRATVRRIWNHRMFDDYMMFDAERPPLLEPEHRKGGNDLVEQVYTREQALRQGRRCFKCHVNVTFDGNLCIMCNGCVHVCPEYCLKLVRLDDIESTPEFEKLLDMRYAQVLRNEKGEIPVEAGAAMLMDAERCIRCGLCAAICPTDAITMEEFNFVEELYEEKVQ